ncbi:MAG: hypothetical protein DYG85_05000 [Chloroflexi bacterium CFX1]|nr:hypothetical protein [Chloroflexi bacterium CFX1]
MPGAPFHSPFPIHYSLLTTLYSLLSAHYSLLTTLYSLFSTLYSPIIFTKTRFRLLPSNSP